MRITRHATINAPASRVWDALAHRFHDVDLWASAVDHSAAHGADPAPDGSPLESGGRVCSTRLGQLEETILHYDEDDRKLSYSALSDDIPFFVRSMANSWHFEPAGKGKSSVHMDMQVELMPVIGTVMAPFMKRQFGTFLDQAIQEFSYFVEQGRPHPRKLAATQTRPDKQTAALKATLSPA